MNGAELLCRTLLANGIDTCFANPGTSEMHLVAALDRFPQMRCILGLAEGVVTGAADGYARMTGRPAATLLHLGPGLANGLANLHNARKARTPMVNVVGDHAARHLELDAPLTSDVDAVARPMSDWTGRATSADAVAEATAQAIAAARGTPGPATLVMPADSAWTDCSPGIAAVEVPASPRPRAGDEAVDAAARRLKAGGRVALILGGPALLGTTPALAGALAEATGATLLAETHSARASRGAGTWPLTKIPYPVDAALELLKGFDAAILIGAKDPVAFFAYPGKPGRLLPDACTRLTLAGPTQDPADALNRLADMLGVDPAAHPVPIRPRPEPPATSAAFDADSVTAMIAATIPEGAVIVDEAITSGRNFLATSQGAAPHDFLGLTGGAIGIGIPLATGAAVGAPGRKVIDMQADGSGFYTLQGLWTQARERLDVLTVIFANRAYRILEGELRNVGALQAGPSARRMLDLGDPDPDWVRLAEGFGVEAARAEDMASFADLYTAALSRPGPFLIEARIP